VRGKTKPNSKEQNRASYLSFLLYLNGLG